MVAEAEVRPVPRLVREVLGAYTDRLMAALGDADDPDLTPADLIERYVDVFRRDLVDDRKKCLCGMLACETASLPPVIGTAARDFFERNLSWLETVLGRIAKDVGPGDVGGEALRVVATCQGALLVAHSLGEVEVFERIVRGLFETLSLHPANR